MKYDIIIIGGGLGGLTAGAKLSKEGRKVLLLEQHDRPGGCATTFRRKAFTMEVGLHEMDGLDRGDMKTRIFNDLGVFDEVEFLKVPEFFHFIQGDLEFTMPHDPGMAISRLTAMFPQEKNGIITFFGELMGKPKRNSENDHIEISVGEYLDSIFNDDKLKLILLGNLGYFHDDPYTLSLSYYRMAQGSYFRGGGNYIRGGSQKLSDYLAGYIQKNGGKVLLNNMATKILTTENRAVGVRYFNKTDPENIREDYATDIICNNSVPAVANDMLPETYGKQLTGQVESTKIGASLLTVYMGFKKPLIDLGSKYYSYFVYDESVINLSDILPNNTGDHNKRSFTFVDYSQINSSLAPAGKSVGAVCCIDYPDFWMKMGKEEYRMKKRETAVTFIEKLDKIIPGLKDQVEYYEVGTSKTVGRYILTPQSAVYGFAQTPEYYMQPKIETIDNLHFASAWTKTGGGFSGAIFSGYMCAFGILRKR